MALTTLRSFVDGLEALDVADVKRTYTDGPPASLNRSDLPVQFVKLPQPAVMEDGWVFGQSGYERTLRAELVIVLEAVGQNVHAENHRLAVDMIDNLCAALEGSAGHDLANGSPQWTVRLQELDVAGSAYWALIADVEAIA